jgi:hypothetical protein
MMMPNRTMVPGAMVLLEGEITDPDQQPLTGVVMKVTGDALLIELTCSSAAPADGTRLVLSDFAPEEMHRMVGTVRRIAVNRLSLEECAELPGIQRRRYSRCAATLEVELIPAEGSDNGAIQGVTIDIGVGGAHLKLTAPLPEGADATMALKFGAGDVLRLAAHVLAAETHEEEFDARVAFADVSPVAEERLADVVNMAQTAWSASRGIEFRPREVRAKGRFSRHR